MSIFRVLVVGFLATVPLASASAEAAHADVVPPPSGFTWQWHTKRLAQPDDDCVAKIGWDAYNGRIYFKRVINCDDVKRVFSLELWLQIDGRPQTSRSFSETCVLPSGGNTCNGYGMSDIVSVANPAGLQIWEFTMDARVNRTNAINPAWWVIEK